jgi:hypothetical protein
MLTASLQKILQSAEFQTSRQNFISDITYFSDSVVTENFNDDATVEFGKFIEEQPLG